VAGHGAETFLQGAMNSCNPVFIGLAERLGVPLYYSYFEQFGLKTKTGIDLPGEAATIMHKEENMGEVELATTAFGQSFQITPIQLITTVSSLINGGNRITPHFGVEVKSPDGTPIETFTYPVEANVLSEKTSETLRYVLEQVVEQGSGKNAYIAGYHVAGKTATSEKLPRSLKKYISSFIGFAPAEDPQVIALITIDEPEGIYYGGTVAAPVIKEIFENILPYMGIEPSYRDGESDAGAAELVVMPSLLNLTKQEADSALNVTTFTARYLGEGDKVVEQFPIEGEKVSANSTVILYLGG
jgi:stage V sporulation protein D (sporulation-specific penicillin-binding protein)